MHGISIVPTCVTMRYKYCSSPQYTISYMLIMFFVLLALQSMTKPPSNQHIYRIPGTPSTMQNFRFSQWCWRVQSSGI